MIHHLSKSPNLRDQDLRLRNSDWRNHGCNPNLRFIFSPHHIVLHTWLLWWFPKAEAALKVSTKYNANQCERKTTNKKANKSMIVYKTLNFVFNSVLLDRGFAFQNNIHIHPFTQIHFHSTYHVVFIMFSVLCLNFLIEEASGGIFSSWRSGHLHWRSFPCLSLPALW
jgi:hypothetical protein